jgi:DNA transposition AAA+ family ATPase
MQTIDIPATELPSDLDETRGEKAHRQIAASPYPGHCKSVLRALVDLMDERGWSQAETAKRIKHGDRKNAISTAALSQLLCGTYRADPEALCRSIARAIDHERGRALFGDHGYAETRLYRAMVSLADIAVATQRIASIHGPQLTGKTAAARHLADTYQRAAVIYMLCPYADTYGGFVRRLARLRGVSLRGTLSDIREGILATLDGSHLLVIDEAHQPLITYAPSQALRVYEFIREINDHSRCAILLIGASAGHAILASEDRYSRISQSLHTIDIADRGLLPAHAEDIAAIAETFGLDDLHSEDQKDALAIVRDHGIQRLYDLLHLAALNARESGAQLSWRHVSAIAEPTLKLAA